MNRKVVVGVVWFVTILGVTVVLEFLRRSMGIQVPEGPVGQATWAWFLAVAILAVRGGEYLVFKV